MRVLHGTSSILRQNGGAAWSIQDLATDKSDWVGFDSMDTTSIQSDFEIPT